jgi:hypothetical protein
MIESPMDYEERAGRSKLSVVRDGLRFLRTILDVGLTYQPFRLISLPGIFLIAVAIGLMLPLVAHYAVAGSIHEGQIYRFLTALVCASGGMELFLIGLQAERTVERSRRKKWPGGLLFLFLRRVVTQRTLALYAAAFFAGAIGLNVEGLRSYLETGFVWQHWSRTAAGAMLVLLGFQCVGSAVMERLHSLLVPVAPPPPSQAVERERPLLSEAERPA